MFKGLKNIFEIAGKAIKKVIPKIKLPWTKNGTPKTTPSMPKYDYSEEGPDDFEETFEPWEQEEEDRYIEEMREEELAERIIDNLIDRVKEMDSEGYITTSPHSWSVSPEKAPNSNGAGIAKEESGNEIVDAIKRAVAETDAVTVARSLEEYWDGILYQIERLEFAIYDTEYRKKSGGRGAYEAGMLKLDSMLKIGSDEPLSEGFAAKV